jgi:hypothetical protein
MLNGIVYYNKPQLKSNLILRPYYQGFMNT